MDRQLAIGLVVRVGLFAAALAITGLVNHWLGPYWSLLPTEVLLVVLVAVILILALKR